jgi:hypothetical protein
MEFAPVEGPIWSHARLHAMEGFVKFHCDTKALFGMTFGTTTPPLPEPDDDDPEDELPLLPLPLPLLCEFIHDRTDAAKALTALIKPESEAA